MWYASGYLHRFHCINTSCKTPAIMKLNLDNLVIPQLQLFRSEVAAYGVYTALFQSSWVALDQRAHSLGACK